VQVAVVTDSTAYLPEGFAERHSVRVVPLTVLVDDKAARDGVDFGAQELIAALAQKKRVTTSRATPTELTAAYREQLDAGADAVVAVHLSKELSGTWEAARVASLEINKSAGDDVVRVVDARTTAMGLGFAALAAARAAAAGADGAEVEGAAVHAAAHTHTYFCVQTLDYLRRGGRIGTAAALFGSALAVKPLLYVRHGHIVGLEKVRTTSRAQARLVEIAARSAGDGPAALAVHHLGAPDLAADLAGRLEERVPAASGCLVSEVGAVIGAHTGPGVLGVVVLAGGLDD
jgi:DegV family protein with EDD domain